MARVLAPAPGASSGMALATGTGPFASRRKRRASFPRSRRSQSTRKFPSLIITRQGVLEICLQRKAPCNWTNLGVKPTQQLVR